MFLLLTFTLCHFCFIWVQNKQKKVRKLHNKYPLEYWLSIKLNKTNVERFDEVIVCLFVIQISAGQEFFSMISIFCKKNTVYWVVKLDLHAAWSSVESRKIEYLDITFAKDAVCETRVLILVSIGSDSLNYL